MRKIASLLILIMFFSIIGALTSGFSFAEETKKLTKQELEIRAQKIDEIFFKVHTGEITLKQANKMLAKMKVYPVRKTKNNVFEIFNDGKTLIDTNIDEQSDVVILSDPQQHITFYKPASYWDSYAGYYYTGAHFFWKNKAWQSDIPSTSGKTRGYWYPMSDYDGFGITFSRSITRVSQTFNVWDDLGGNTSYTSPSNVSPYGIVFRGQDKWMIDTSGNLHYNWDSGFMGVYWLPQETGLMSISQELAHTWNTSTVSVSSIGPWSIGWNISNYNYGWSIANATPELFTP